ncbi:hypothetical protein M378DRAFT_322104 [Amanita muscaria Koide BX008]|uniref:Uncharacterized protein n=1 Tax=Amanita muscaria (strain Koide BX008) TaxID=946122 RepID=A0A0C2WYR7_AMAMK|nr:hypothetical protein M378DRAFT_322104 [Amanita muscaria Koide BX008]
MHNADDITNEILEELKSLDLTKKLAKLPTALEQALEIHQSTLVQGIGYRYQTTFNNQHPNFDKQPSFIATMLDAYSKGDYRTILSWRPARSPRPPLPGAAQREASKAVMARQYSVPYKGKVAELFAEFVQNHARRGRRDLYANVIPVIQSSGTGKSRMLTEVRLARHFSLYPFVRVGSATQGGRLGITLYLNIS